VWEVFEHFSGDVAFQNPGDLSHCLAFGESPGDVVAGSLVVALPGDDHVESAELAWRLPPRSSRCRFVLPDEAGWVLSRRGWPRRLRF